MRNLVTLVAAAVLFVSSLLLPVFGHAEPPPPAFGKELVPDKQFQGGDGPKTEEIEEHPDGQEHPDIQPGQRGQRGQKLHIQLYGTDGGADAGDDSDDDAGDDSDDGGDDSDDGGDDSGEF